MNRNLNKLRFSKNMLNEETFNKFLKYLGPVQNFLGAKTIQFLNLRILYEDKQRKFKVVNDYHHKYEFSTNEYIRSLLRALSDGIFVNEKYVLNNSEDNLELISSDFGIDPELYVRITPRNDNKKPIGIMSKDLKFNLIKNHLLFQNKNAYKYLIVSEEKFEKFNNFLKQNNLQFNDEIDYQNVDVKTTPKLNLINALNIFFKEAKSELVLLEGFGDQSLQFLPQIDPLDIPVDILIIAFTKDGEYYKEEISRNFDIWNKLEQNFVKLYQSKNLMGEDGSTWFYAVLKKRMLVQRKREVLDLKNENRLFDQSVFKNFVS